MKKLALILFSIFIADAGARDSPRGTDTDARVGSGRPSCAKGDPGCNAYKPENKKSDGNGMIMIATAGGIAIVGILWYIFRAPPSSNFAGQSRLASF